MVFLTIKIQDRIDVIVNMILLMLCRPVRAIRMIIKNARTFRESSI